MSEMIDTVAWWLQIEAGMKTANHWRPTRPIVERSLNLWFALIELQIDRTTTLKFTPKT